MGEGTARRREGGKGGKQGGEREDKEGARRRKGGKGGEQGGVREEKEGSKGAGELSEEVTTKLHRVELRGELLSLTEM